MTIPEPPAPDVAGFGGLFAKLVLLPSAPPPPPPVFGKSFTPFLPGFDVEPAPAPPPPIPPSPPTIGGSDPRRLEPPPPPP